MAKHAVAGPLEANRLVAQILKLKKETNPLHPVSFVTDNYRQGAQLTYQLITAYLAETSSESVVGITQITPLDLLESFCGLLDIEWSKSDYENASSDLVSIKLYAGETFLDPQKLTSSTVNQIQKLVHAYQWIDFGNEDLSLAVAESDSTETSKKLFDLAKAIELELSEVNTLSPARMVKKCSESDNLTKLQEYHRDASFIFLTQDCPSPLVRLVETVIPEENFDLLEIIPEEAKELASTKFDVTSFPDVMSEVRAGVAKAVEYILESGKAEDVAILYSDEDDYSKHLRMALDNVGVSWNGPDKNLLLNTKVAALVVESLSIAAGTGSRKLDRKFLLKVIRSGLLRRPDYFVENFSWVRVEKYIRERALFNEADKWVPQLIATAEGLAELEKELAELEISPEDNEDLIRELNREIVNSRAAQALLQLIRRFGSFINTLQFSASLTEQSIMQETLALLEDLIGQPTKRRLAEEEKECLEALNLFAQVASKTSPAGERFSLQALLSKLQSLFSSGQNYKKGPGIYVGLLDQHPLRAIKYQVLLGVSDGAFPRRRQEDPVFPDSIKSSLGDTYANIFPSVTELSKRETTRVLSVLSSAHKMTLSFSRNGLIGQGSGHLSAAIEKLAGETKRVESFESFTDELPNAVLKLDLIRKSRLSGMSGTVEDRQSFPGLDSMVALASNEYGAFSGNLGSGLRTFRFENSLSASAVETYLKCPHKFFVTRILGFSFEDEDDEVETLRALDYGSLVHESLELFQNYCIQNQLVPDFGEPYSAKAIEVFRKIFNDQCDQVIARGQAGWLPLFEQKRRNFLVLTDLYFEKEHEFRSMAPKKTVRSKDLALRPEFVLRPHLAEYNFDSKGMLPLEIQVTSSANNPKKLLFKGQMDRVDKSISDTYAGIIDFKTSKSDRITASKEELIQDLLYSHALRKNLADFANVKFVSFVYLTLNTAEQSKIVRLRDVDFKMYFAEADGGYSPEQLVTKIQEENNAQDELLLTKLRAFVDSNEQGSFPPFAESRTARYCEVCAESFGSVRAKAIYENAKH